MKQPSLDDRVRLTRPIPTLYLECGSVGLVRSVWRFSPTFYEVEFQQGPASCPIRALLQCDQLDVIEAARKQTTVAATAEL